MISEIIIRFVLLIHSAHTELVAMQPPSTLEVKEVVDITKDTAAERYVRLDLYRENVCQSLNAYIGNKTVKNYQGLQSSIKEYVSIGGTSLRAMECMEWSGQGY